MKKIISTLAMFSFLAISASAYATTWKDVYNPADIKLNGGDEVSFTHVITDNGFDIGKDTVTSANLIVDLDNDIYKTKLTINLPVIDGNDSKNFSYDNSLLNVSLTGLIHLNADGELSVIIKCLQGAFNFDQSTLDATGTECLPVPEPGTSALLGVGLITLGFFLRRRLTV